MELVKIKNQYQSEFVKLIKSFNWKFYTWEIFADFIVMFACAISNAVDKIHAEAREKMYLWCYVKITDTLNLYFLGKSAKCTKWSHLFHGLLDNEPLMA